MKKIKEKLTIKKLLKLLALTAAGIINAFGVSLVLAPVNLFDSGISGTAYLLDVVTPPIFTMSLFLLVLNIPFYLLAVKKVGKRFVIKSVYAIVVYSLFAFIFRDLLENEACNDINNE